MSTQRTKGILNSKPHGPVVRILWHKFKNTGIKVGMAFLYSLYVGNYKPVRRINKFGTEKSLGSSRIAALQGTHLTYWEEQELLNLYKYYEQLLKRQAILWGQKSRISGLKYGDRNTKFFSCWLLLVAVKGTILTI